MEYKWELFLFVLLICFSMGIVGNHILKKLQEISDKLQAISNLNREGNKKLDDISDKLQTIIIFNRKDNEKLDASEFDF